ncbi:hypothetical protein [Capnocytophaga sp. oral taxon 338]|uniref:hypothetical protein n=1 Tax=Capnocytophaga sp. oral taxon 338 TaxID=710239 RepID=UPI000202BFFE|nr:hypothetical protein [Capnocytophaga sp. oral taxon 338]EGD34029.1 hypothetical protein HMPREF9071_1409 [Capnocytophaga sp. oral taxon 338 str. F0234]
MKKYIIGLLFIIYFSCNGRKNNNVVSEKVDSLKIENTLNVNAEVKEPVIDFTFPLDSLNYKQVKLPNSYFPTNVIEWNACGSETMDGMYLGEYNEFKIFIVENVCGDASYKMLFSTKERNVIDSLEIENYYVDPAKDFENIIDIQKSIFTMKSIDSIEIKSMHSIDGKMVESKTNSYHINAKGKFVKD